MNRLQNLISHVQEKDWDFGFNAINRLAEQAEDLVRERIKVDSDR